METTDTAAAGASAPRGLAEQVRQGAASQLSAQKNRAMDSLGNIAQAARQTTQALRDNQQDTIANYVSRAADQIERFSTRLRDRDITDLMQDAQQFARRQPAVFIGAAFAVGVLAARFLKSSASANEYGYGYGRPAGRRFS